MIISTCSELLLGEGEGSGDALTLSTPYRTSGGRELVTSSLTQKMGSLTVHYPNWDTSQSEGNGLNNDPGIAGINWDCRQQSRINGDLWIKKRNRPYLSVSQLKASAFVVAVVSF